MKYEPPNTPRHCLERVGEPQTCQHPTMNPARNPAAPDQKASPVFLDCPSGSEENSSHDEPDIAAGQEGVKTPPISRQNDMLING